MGDVLLVDHESLKKFVIIRVDSAMKILKVAKITAVKFRIGKLSILFNFIFHNDSARVHFASLEDNRFLGSYFLFWCF